MAVSFTLRVVFGPILLLLNLLKPQLHFLILFGKLFNGGRKSLDLLSQGCGILIGLHLDIEVDGNCVFEYEYGNVVPTNGAKLMKCEFVNHSGQMEPIPSLCECILKDGHRCGACHNVSDAKVSTRELFVS